MVGRFLNKLARALVGEDGEEARRAIHAAYEARVKLRLEPLKTSIANATIMTAMIEQVGDEDFVISQPVIEGVARRLLVGETLRISFPFKPLGYVACEADVLGRFKIPSGGGPALHGFQLSMPWEVYPDERRQGRRKATSMNLAREVELYRNSKDEPIRGVVQNLSLGGMQIRTHDSPDPPLRPGERVRLVVHLPPPVGGVNRMVTIARLAGNKNPRHRVIGIAFERELDGLRDLLNGSARSE